MTKTTSIYFKDENGDSIAIMILDEYYYDFKTYFEVRYKNNDVNAKVHTMVTTYILYEEALTNFEVLTSFLKKTLSYSKATKQTITHEDF